MDLLVESYRLSCRLPLQERYGLTARLRRVAVSIPANIAEGNGCLHRGDYVHHLSIARGSLLALETHFEIAARLDYLGESDLAGVRERIGHVRRMLNRLTTRLRR